MVSPLFLSYGPVDRESGLSGVQWLQQAIWERHRVRTLRCTLAEIAEEGSLDASGQLRVDDSVVAVTYFRAGYSPNDYPTEVEWKARCDSTDAPLCNGVVRSTLTGLQLAL